MISYPNAKINLGLSVLRKREDGFHDIESVFYPVKWRDILEIVPSGTGQGKVDFSSSGIDIPSEASSNLCVKAYLLLHEDHDLPSVKIHLHKLVPIGAGLGGGSADASFALGMLNELFGLGLSAEKLESHAAQLGSDCPFFIRNRPALVTGRGDKMTPVKVDLTDHRIVLINPQIHIGTAEAYAKIRPSVPEVTVGQMINKPVSEWKNTLKNDFEESVFPGHPRISNIKETLYESGAIYASMTGSGSTVFGLFEKEIDLADMNDCLIKWC